MDPEKKFEKTALTSFKRVTQAFGNIKNTLYGNDINNPDVLSDNPSSDLLNRKIDDSIERLSKSVINRNALNYAENLKTVLTQNLSSDKIDANVTSGLMSTPEYISRVGRYKNFDEIINNITYCARALKVLTSGILSPDNVQKKILKISTEDVETDDIKDSLNKYKSINEALDVDSQSYDIVKETLKDGDHFVEICDFKSDEIPVTQSLFLTEARNYKEFKNIITENFNAKHKNNKNSDYYDSAIDVKYNVYKFKDNNIDKPILDSTKTCKIKLSIVEDIQFNNMSNLNESKTTKTQPNANIKVKKNNKKSDPEDEKIKTNKEIRGIYKEDLQDIKLIVHNPRRVIKLQSDRNKMNLGYLILPENMDGKQAGTFGLPAGFSHNTGGGGGAVGGGMSFSNTRSGVRGLDFSNSTNIDRVYKEILNIIKTYLSTEKISVDRKEIKDLLIKTIKDIEEGDEYDLKIRYVPPDRMEHFKINSTANFPYGESIFQPIVQQAKLYIALKTAITIRRITDSSEKRLIYVDMQAQRNAKNVIENLKEVMNKRKYTLDKFNDISTIPSMMSAYEELYLPTIRGKRIVEFDTLQPQANIRDITDELKMMRDELVSGLDVPAPFLSIEDNISNKAVLGHESSMFAENLLLYQQIFKTYFSSLFKKIYKYAYKELPPAEITVSMNPPKMLFSEREAEHIGIVSQMIDILENLGINKEYSKQKYLNIDWDELKEFDIEDKLERRSKPSHEEDFQDGGGMGGFGGGAPPMGGGGMGGF